MILPLISIPAFAEDEVTLTPVNFSQNFDSAENVGDVFNAYGSETKLEDGAFRLDYAAGTNGKYYVSANSTTGNHKYEISDPVIEDGVLVSGTVTISDVTYNVTGNVNSEDSKSFSQKATLTSTADESEYTANTLYVVTAKSVDALHGGINVGKQNNLKIDAISTDYEKIAFSADYFISTDVPKGSSFEITWSSTSRVKNTRVDIAKLVVQDGYVEMSHHGDAGSPKSGYTYLRTPKGQWFNVKALFDLTTGNIELYLNGDYGLTITDEDLTVGFRANSLSLAQITRSATQAPSAMKGYVLIDNVSVTSENKVYSASDFDQYAGITAFRGGTYASNFAYGAGTPSKLTSVTENGNTYLKYNFGADLANDANYVASTGGVDGDGDGVVDFYAYSGYTRWEHNKDIASYDFDTHVLTTKDGTEYTVTAQGDANVANGFYGTFAYTDGKTYRLTSPLYAAATQLGDGNIDKNVSVRVSPYSYEDYTELYFSAKYYIEPGSYGTAQSQFYQMMKNGAANTWNDLYTINLATGAFSRGGYLPIGEWCEVGFKANLVTGDFTFYIDGLQVATVNPFGTNLALRKAAAEYGNCGWILAKQFKSADVINAKGSISVDDVRISEISEMPPLVLGKVNFENETVGAAPSTNSIAKIAVADSKIDDTLGSKAWKIDYERPNGVNKYNVDKNNYALHSGASYETVDSVVFEADYFIEGGATGKIQSQLTPLTANGTKYSWSDLYCIWFAEENTNAWIEREGGTSHGKLEFHLGRWNTISAVLNLKTGELDVYVNGVLGIDSYLDMNGEEAKTRANIVFGANTWDVGKVNKVNGAGTFYMDNLKVFAGTAPSVAPEAEKTVLDFEEFLYADGMLARKSGFTAAPALLTFAKQADGNMAVRLDMGAASSPDEWALYTPAGSGKVLNWNVECYMDDLYLVYDEVEYDIYDDGDIPYVMIPDAEGNDVKYYVIPADCAEAAQNRGNVGAGTSIDHPTYSYEDSTYAIFEADYFIEPGSTGVIESQFAGYHYDAEVDGETVRSKGGWIQLFQIHMDTGLIAGQGNPGKYRLSIGEWNHIKVVANLETGVFDIYANGVWAKSFDTGYANIIVGDAAEWSVAKVVRQNSIYAVPFEGGILFDNYTTYAADELTVSENHGDKFLTDAAYDAYLEGLITIKDGASIRLADPSGLRFASKVDTDKLAHLNKIVGAEVVKMGTLITPADYLASTENVDRATLEAINKTNKYLDVEFDGTYFSGDANFNLAEGEKYMVGSIVNILAGNISREFAGLGYIELEIGGEVVEFYTDVTVRSVQEVAAAALDADVSYTEGQLAILNAYAAGNQPS